MIRWGGNRAYLPIRRRASLMTRVALGMLFAKNNCYKDSKLYI